MNSRHKKSIGTAFFLFALAGCESLDLPHVMGGNEVPPEVIAQPRVVTTPAPGSVENSPWMRLGDVPSAPRDFTSQTLIDQTAQEMRDDRTEAEKLKQQADMPPAPQP